MTQYDDGKDSILVTYKKNELLKRARTLQISTGMRNCEHIEWGVAPFIRKDGMFFIYVSELGGHVRSMLDNNPVLFSIIEDEKNSQNIWARVRLKFTAEINEIARGCKEFQIICDDIAEHHGPVMKIIRDFSDFHLFAISPKEGVIVTGFGSAFKVTGNDFNLEKRITSNA